MVVVGSKKNCSPVDQCPVPDQVRDCEAEGEDSVGQRV